MVQTAEKKQQIGLLGGTFDPVHNGHLAVSNHVRHALGLDSIWFVPAALPPHKAEHGDGQNITSFAHRFAMVERAITVNSSFVVSDIEAKRSSPSYSIDTIKILLPLIGENAELYFIIGADAFVEIDTWKRFKELPSLISFVIISRPGLRPEKIEEAMRNIFTGYEYDPVQDLWISPYYKGSFILLHMEPVAISSTEIRKRVKMGEEVTGLVPAAVEAYIKKHKLYI